MATQSTHACTGVCACRHAVQEGAGGAALGRYLQSANSRVQVWLQVRTAAGGGGPVRAPARRRRRPLHTDSSAGV